MLIHLIAFTEKGKETAIRISEGLDEEFILWDKGSEERAAFAKKAFALGDPLVFVGAAGIAVRTIAPFVKDKLEDPPVIVVDELAMHVIPILSGHYGGANELAVRIAEALGAVPVITTATDINKAFSVDVFAREKGLRIKDRESIAKVSTKALAGKPVTICVEGYPPAGPVDVLISESGSCGEAESLITLEMPEGAGEIAFAPEGLVLGIGCRKGVPSSEIRVFAEECLREAGLAIADVSAIASIDIKAEEPGIKALSEELSVPFITFSGSVLAEAPGEYTSSEFVREKTGVDNVCERAAVTAAGPGSELLIRKQARNGITIACAAKREKTDD